MMMTEGERAWPQWSPALRAGRTGKLLVESAQSMAPQWSPALGAGRMAREFEVVELGWLRAGREYWAGALHYLRIKIRKMSAEMLASGWSGVGLTTLAIACVNW